VPENKITAVKKAFLATGAKKVYEVEIIS